MTIQETLDIDQNGVSLDARRIVRYGSSDRKVAEVTIMADTGGPDQERKGLAIKLNPAEASALADFLQRCCND